MPTYLITSSILHWINASEFATVTQFYLFRTRLKTLPEAEAVVDLFPEEAAEDSVEAGAKDLGAVLEEASVEVAEAAARGPVVEEALLEAAVWGAVVEANRTEVTMLEVATFLWHHQPHHHQKQQKHHFYNLINISGLSAACSFHAETACNILVYLNVAFAAIV